MRDRQPQHVEYERIIYAPQLQRGPRGREGGCVRCGKEQHARFAQQMLNRERERMRKERVTEGESGLGNLIW